MSAKYNLVCDQATTFNFQFQVQNNVNGAITPWNLTGYTGTMTVRPFVGASTTTVVASTANGYMTFDALNGRVTVTIPASVTDVYVAGCWSRPCSRPQDAWCKALKKRLKKL